MVSLWCTRMTAKSTSQCQINYNQTKGALQSHTSAWDGKHPGMVQSSPLGPSSPKPASANYQTLTTAHNNAEAHTATAHDMALSCACRHPAGDVSSPTAYKSLALAAQTANLSWPSRAHHGSQQCRIMKCQQPTSAAMLYKSQSQQQHQLPTCHAQELSAKSRVLVERVSRLTKGGAEEAHIETSGQVMALHVSAGPQQMLSHPRQLQSRTTSSH